MLYPEWFLAWAMAAIGCSALSMTPRPPPQYDGDLAMDRAPSSARRDWLWKLPVGAVGTYVYGRLCYNALSQRGIQYPEEHERRVARTVENALLSGVRPGATDLRVLEVGVGRDLRLLRRGLYDGAFHRLSDTGVRRVTVVGVDPLSPTDATLRTARQRAYPTDVDIQFVRDSIESRLDYSDGYFDAVVCCLTLCSVQTPPLALREMDRLLRPDGGCFGYIEHVAVDPDEPYRFLEYQQQLLDPVQQALADNCHLHRYTQAAIADEFLRGETAVELASERYTVGAMWPVTCQACGVIQKRAPVRGLTV